MLFQKQKRRNGMRTQANEARHPTAEGPRQTLLANDVCQCLENSMVMSMRSRHDSRLDHVNGTADSRGDETRQERRRKMCRQIILHPEILKTDPFEDIVCCQLRGSHKHSSHGVWPDAPEQALGTFVSDHLVQAVDSMLVIPTLRRRQSQV